MKLTIDVTSDVICPWCLIGKRRLEKALALAGRTDAIVRWHPFQLNPRMPKQGVERQRYRIAKFGSLERSQALEAQVHQAGLGDGIFFAFDKIARTPNTLDAHRLIRFAGEEGIQDAVMEALFLGYFTEGKDIGDVPTLLDMVTEAGMNRVRAEALLAGSDDLAAIAAEEESAKRAGIQGVPFFRINNESTLSGAQDPRAFVAAFESLAPASKPAGQPAVCKAGPTGKASC